MRFDIFVNIVIMFSFLKKSSSHKHIDKVWKTRQACLKGMMTEALHVISKSGKPVILSWFEDRHQTLLEFLDKYQVPYVIMDEYFDLSADKSVFILNAEMVLSSLHVDSFRTKSKTIIADGHYPIDSHENSVIEKLCDTSSANSVLFCLSLEDQLLKYFGSENIISLLEKLGLDENESLDHPMIQKAIERAREKISTSVLSEIRTQNESDWFTKNVKKS
jgi:hypothetical protein